jgi:hypothetical protein
MEDKMEDADVIWLIQKVKRIPSLNLVMKDTITICKNKEIAEKHISEIAALNKIKIPEHAMGFDFNKDEGIYSTTLLCYKD